jgi:hypothetical protein
VAALAPLAATGLLIRRRQLRLGRDPRRRGVVYDPSVLTKLARRWRHILPWIVSAGLLAYVFGWATDWQRLWAAIEHANVPIFVALATADRLGFFVVWTWFQAEAAPSATRSPTPPSSWGWSSSPADASRRSSPPSCFPSPSTPW